jgi:hypothetical protein
VARGVNGMSVPPECLDLANGIEALEQERNGLQEELHNAAPGEKPALVAQIRALNRQIAAASDALAACIASTPPPPPPPPPLQATFTGTATITTTNSSAPGPFTAGIQLGLLFDGNRTSVIITSFPPIATQPFSTPFGTNVTTVTKTGGGFGSYANGNIVMPLTLHFDQSLDLPFFEEDSDLSVGVSTNPPGSPVDPTGGVTLAGSGVFQGGFLGGATGTLSISGTISPVP